MDNSMWSRQIQAYQNDKETARLNQQMQSGQKDPAALRLANEYLEAVRNGNTAKANAIAQFAKTLPKGAEYGADGTMNPQAGYFPFVQDEAFNKKMGDQTAITVTAAEIERQKTLGSPVPAAAQDKINEDLSNAASIGEYNKDLANYKSMLDDGRMDLGPIDNFGSTLRNLTGNSSPQSRNYGNFKADLERLRNESLRLNTGVQTEGDAVRIWNELVSGPLNDNAFVSSRLTRIMELNDRAAQLKKGSASRTLENYGRDPSRIGASPYRPAPPDLPPVFGDSEIPPALPAADAPPVQGAGNDIPAGAKLIGTSKGKKVYQLPDGSHVMEQ